MSRRVPPTHQSILTNIEDLPPVDGKSFAESAFSRRVPPSAVTDNKTEIEDVPELVASSSEVSSNAPSLTEIMNDDKFGEILSKPNMIEEMMSQVQANPQAASMVRGMVNDPAARREMNRLIQSTGADLQMMNSLNKRKNAHRNDRPKRKEILKLQKTNKSLVKTPKLPTLKILKITASRQVKQIDVPTDTFPHCCLAKITTDTDAILGVKEFLYLVDGKEKCLTLLYVEDSKGCNKLIKQKFGAEYGREVLVVSGSVDNPDNEFTPTQFERLPLLKLLAPTDHIENVDEE